MKYVFCLFSFLLCSISIAQHEFDTGLMDPALSLNADAVIRTHEEVYTVKTIGKALKYEHLAVTVLNEKGENEFSSFSVNYDRFTSIRKIEGAIYDAKGERVEKLKKDNIKDYGNSYEAYEISDSREKIAYFDKKKYTYPYTIEYIITQEITTGMFYPLWFPVEYEYTAIEKSMFSIITPPDISFRYKEMKLPKKGTKVIGEKEITYLWTLEHVAAIEFEDYANNDERPVVFTAPNNFEVDFYKGNASSWKEIGTFYNTLNAHRDSLPELTRKKVQQLAPDKNDTLKNISALYSYMQSVTRYASIQLGIGGWQTIKAVDVDRKGYGDCKALSNYMVSLLKEANIKAYPVLILAGNSYYDIQEDFPCFKFNHCIVCVPLQNDTLWLECTSQTNAMGYLGSFTGNRKALVITETGGKLVNTLVYSAKDNTCFRKAVVHVKEDGEASASVTAIYRGIKQETVSNTYHSLNKEKQKEAIVKSLNNTSVEAESFFFKEERSVLPQITESLQLKIHKLIPKSNATVFITPVLFPQSLYLPTEVKERTSSFYLNPNYYNYSTSDTIVYHFEKTLSPESLPQAVTIKSLFGEYSATFSFKDNQLIYCRHLTLKGGTFAGEQYANWIGFVKQVNKSDKLKVVFSQK